MTFKSYQYRAMRIPIGFVDGIGLTNEHGELCIRDPKGRVWHVGVNHYGRSVHFPECPSCLRANHVKFLQAMETNEKCAGLRFFKPFLDNSSAKMLIPSAFSVHLSKKRRREIATLMSQNGKKWHVEVSKDRDGSLYMGGEGWRKFVQANELETGYMLVFKYKGSMVFTFKVFDFSGCRKSDGSTAPKSSVRKKRTVQEISDDVQEISDDENFSSNQKQTMGTSKKKKATELKPSSSSSSMKEFKEKSIPSFQIRFKNFHFCHLMLPSEFRHSAGLTNQLELTIRDSQGQVWPVRLKHHSGPMVVMSKGWPGCARANHVKVGDKLIFELLSSTEKVIHVKLNKL